MSTYLQLCSKTRQNMRVSGATISTVAAQTGELKRVIDWVADAWSDIQLRYIDWRWMRSRFTVNTVASTDTYAYGSVTDSRLNALIDRFSRWIILDDRGFSNITMFLTSSGVAGERYLIYLPWSDFRYIYKRGMQSTITGVPAHFTIDPDNNLVLGPNPNDIYTVRGEYQMSPQVLSLDADVPEMPAQFHDLIMYRTMEKISTDLVAPEKLERAVKEGNRIMRALEQNQRPIIGIGGPLA
ncbi:hypothetical protein GALL_153360 [mine drainage metagenome]|uniref:Uncharacterized protein n=1 Tax=mine drainage metagenome TaxID=410659 RepID=A0A1J5SRB8_9ZZZZ